jgi:CRP-like cAMP-binding protein
MARKNLKHRDPPSLHMSVFPDAKLNDWPRNRLLLALPTRVRGQIMSSLEPVKCEREQVLVDADTSLDHIYFPDSGVISVVAVYPDGAIIEMATIGREGSTGFQAVFGAKVSSARLLVQIPGTAARMPRRAFARSMETIPIFRSLMQAHVHAFLEQVMISAGCNGAHGLKQRLARWLLMMRDRADGDTLAITQDLLAEMLGVQRPSITNTIHALERAGLIDCGRRRVTILDRDGLIRASCECYLQARSRISQHLPKTYQS